MISASRILIAAAVCAAVFSAGIAHADVSMEQRMSVQGAGMMSMANMTGTSVTTISGNRSRTESDLRFESAMMRTLARSAMGPTVEIVDLDKDRILDINTKKKTYTENSFEAKRAELQKAMQAMQQGQAQQSQGTSGVDESQCEWLPAKSDIRRGGDKGNIAGYSAEHIVITASQPCKDRKTGQVCEFGLTLDQWVAPDFKDSAETLRYQQAYAEKLGLAASGSRDFSERAQQMFGRYEGIWSQIATRMKDVKGYPVKASFGLGVGGAQCQQAQQAKSAGAGGNGAPTSVSGALMQGALGGLGGMFGGKKKQEAAQPAAVPVQSANGMINLMTIGTELVSVKTDAAPAGAFEAPAGFKLVQAN